ncbi:MAG: xanthine dehydrogenase family protein molybdopterin-binding subunit [Acidobacteriia bacterium]|nr:xanthine dehydrogenase family protein molybdopterin-binding subunit [Terriglobia bacterium]
MSDYKLIGHNYITPDLVAKVTGQAKYAEDVRADGMLVCRLLGSPMPHARVRRIDASAALAMPGVRAILTADDLPVPPVAAAPSPPPAPGTSPAPAARSGAAGEGGRRGQRAIAVDEHGQPIGGAAPTPAAAAPAGTLVKAEAALTMEPLYEGEPILAIAAVDEPTAVAAIERIAIDFEPLPFVVDPLEGLRPGSPNARREGNVLLQGNRIVELKWTDADFAAAALGQLPAGAVPDGDAWSFGDVDAGFTDAALVVDESFVIPTTSHIPLEPRSAMAYWQNGKLYMHCSTQSLAQSVPAIARYCGISPSQVVLISPYTGGAFGGKNPAYLHVAIPALLAKKTGQPVMMKITRDDEMNIGRSRPGMIGRAKVGFAKDGRITAIDLFVVSDGGPYGRGDHGSGARLASVLYQPKAMRFRGVGVLTNTVPRGSQRGPGMQIAPAMELVISKAARTLGIDQVAIHRINAPAGKAPVGPPQRDGSRRYVTSAFVKEALDKGADLFGWHERKAASGTRHGSKVRGVGVAVGTYSAGSVGYDGLLTIEPDGKLYIQSGCGHLGTNSVFDTTRAAAEALDMPWDKVVITQGDSTRNLPWSCSQGGSQTAHAHTRANWAAGLDAKRKLQEIAAKDLGGRAEDYTVGGERVYRTGAPGRGLTFAQAAKRAIDLGGAYDGHELPSEINAMTKASATALAGRGLMGVAKDTFKHDGDTMSFVAGFAEVEVDVETGEFAVVDYTAVVDVGTVLHPRNCQGQTYGGSLLGMAHAIGHRWVYDRHYGLALARRFYHSKPPSLLDAPRFQWAAVNLPDPETPVGVRGVGEPPVGAAYGAVVNALVDALGDDAFRRTPVMADSVLASFEAGGKPARGALAFHV